MTSPTCNTESDSVLGRFHRAVPVFVPVFSGYHQELQSERKPFIISNMRVSSLSADLIVYRFSSVFSGFLGREVYRFLGSILPGVSGGWGGAICHPILRGQKRKVRRPWMYAFERRVGEIQNCPLSGPPRLRFKRSAAILGRSKPVQRDDMVLF